MAAVAWSNANGTSFPTTDAVCRSALSPGASRSIRAASTACTVAGTSMAGSGRASRYPALASERVGLDKGPYALLQEERIALGPLDQHALQRVEVGVGPEQGAEKLFGGLRQEGVQPEL
jgi:hypothetical protein